MMRSGGNMERVQVLRDELEEVELENGKKEEREGLKKEVEGSRDL